MKRAFRILTGGLSGLCLMLAIASLIFWVRSYWIADIIAWQGWIMERPAPAEGDVTLDESSGFLQLQRGYLTFWVRTQHATMARAAGKALEKGNRRTGPNWKSQPAERNSTVLFGSSGRPMNFIERLGFYVRTRVGRSPTTRYYDVAFPFWVVSLAGIPGAVWLIRWHIRRRRGVGGGNLCGHCGYDMRATPERCPECGQIAGSV